MGQFNFNNRGFSLIQVAVFGTIMGIISLGTLKFIAQMGKGVKTNERRNQRDQLFSNLEAAVRNPANLRATQDWFPTSTLGRCGLAGGGNDCPHGTVNQFDAYNVQGTRIAGTVANPVRYTAEGAICGVASPECPYEALATFQATCQGNVNCDQPLNIMVRTRLRVAPSISQVDGSMIRLNEKQSDNYTIPIREIATIGAKDCPAGRVFTGLDKHGNAMCIVPPTTSCPSGQYISSVDFANSKVNCTSTASLMPNVTKHIPPCPANQYITGFNSTTGARICSYAHQNGECPGNQYLSGHYQNGTRICRSYAFSGCPQPPANKIYVINGINANGSPNCVLMDPRRCPNRTIAIGTNWNMSPICMPVHAYYRCIITAPVNGQTHWVGEQFESSQYDCEYAGPWGPFRVGGTTPHFFGILPQDASSVGWSW